MPSPDKKTLERLIDGQLTWEELKPVISGTKDADRFDQLLSILQDRVSWKESILLPLHEHLYIVAKDGTRIVKCDCGYEFGDYRKNWKTKCRVRVRDTSDALEELYPKYMSSDPAWEELPDKFYMDYEKADKLLGPGLKIIREKMNGVARIFQVKHLEVHYEDIRKRRVIPYTSLPVYDFVYAIRDTVTNRMLTVEEVAAVCKEYGWRMPPILLTTQHRLSAMDAVRYARRCSAFNPEHICEGIIIINEDLGIEGKIVNPEYDDNKHPDIYTDLEWEKQLENNTRT